MRGATPALLVDPQSQYIRNGFDQLANENQPVSQSATAIDYAGFLNQFLLHNASEAHNVAMSGIAQSSELTNNVHTYPSVHPSIVKPSYASLIIKIFKNVPSRSAHLFTSSAAQAAGNLAHTQTLHLLHTVMPHVQTPYLESPAEAHPCS